ncbi:MAG: TIGR01777 family oxidoreductase [Candidatus Zixiibacteriota bacterium]
MNSARKEISKRVIITGATGFIGNALCRELIEGGYETVGLSRNPEMGKKLLPDQVKVVKWDTKSGQGWANYADGAYAIVNLAGENIASGGWTKERKKRILQSRLDAGRAVVEAVEKVKNKPSVIIQASGIGYYGDCGDQILDETSSPGSGFLVEVAKQWEKTTQKVESFGVRQVIIRTGVVLGKEEGFLTRVILPYRFFVGGHMGSGRQWVPWIHIEDEARAIRFLMEKKDLQGAFNLSSPHPLTSRDFSKVLGKVMKKPAWLPVPGFVLRLLLGEMASELILSGQRALPKKLLESGYEFIYPELEPALREILDVSPHS